MLFTYKCISLITFLQGGVLTLKNSYHLCEVTEAEKPFLSLMESDFKIKKKGWPEICN